MSLSRRGLLGGLLAVISAPAIVRVGSLMALPRPEIIKPSIDLLVNTAGFQVGDIISLESGEEFVVTQTSNSLLSVNTITREAIKFWTDSNREFAALQPKLSWMRPPIRMNKWT